MSRVERIGDAMTSSARIALWAAVLATAASMLLVWTQAARGHGAYEWVSKNPTTAWCCNVLDCSPLSDALVTDDDPAFTLRLTGQKFERGTTGTYDSIDERFHVCNFPDGRARCLFVPKRGY